MDFGCRIGAVCDFLNELRKAELAFSVVQLKIEFFRVHAAYMDRSNVTHRRDGKGGVEQNQVLLRWILSQFREAQGPAGGVVVFRVKSPRVCVLQNLNHGKTLRTHLTVLKPSQGVAVCLVNFAELRLVWRKVWPSKILVASRICGADTPAGVKVRPPEIAGCCGRNAEAQVGSRVTTMIKVRAENRMIMMKRSERMGLLKVTNLSNMF